MIFLMMKQDNQLEIFIQEGKLKMKSNNKMENKLLNLYGENLEFK